MNKDSARGRLHYLDNLRTALVMLVVAHHVSLVYSAFAPFYYQEPPFTDPLAYVVLGVFALSNQAWFMGALFFLAGYFTPGSHDRNGAGDFLRSRSIRLGIPLLAAILIIEPVTRLGFFLMPASLTGITSPPSLAAYPKMVGLGPMWFIAMLLIFDFGYAAWRRFVPEGRPAPGRRSGFPGIAAAAAFITALAVISYLFRIVAPMGRDIHLVVPFLSFPTIAYLPQYLGLFVLGAIAYRREWLADLPASAGLTGLALAALASVLLFPATISGRMFSLAFSPAAEFTGHGSWQSAAYALWDSTMAVGVTLWLITVFRRFVGSDGTFARFLSRHSYAVYVIHTPLVVFIAYGLHGLALPALAKFIVAFAVILPACFAAAYALRKVPGVAKVL